MPSNITCGGERHWLYWVGLVPRPSFMVDVAVTRGTGMWCNNMELFFFLYVSLVLRQGPVLGQCSFSPMNIAAGCYRYMKVLLLLDANQAPIPPLSWLHCPTAIHVDLLMRYLSSHPDPIFASYIYIGLCESFHIGFNRSSTRLQSASRNHPSSLADPTVVENHIATEVSAGRRLVGPVVDPRTPLIHVSPLGLVPKSHQVDRWRMIVDLSFPHGRLLMTASHQLCSLAYASVDDAVEHILHLGRSAPMVKMDLKDVYRMVPIHSYDQSLFEISW